VLLNITEQNLRHEATSRSTLPGIGLAPTQTWWSILGGTTSFLLLILFSFCKGLYFIYAVQISQVFANHSFSSYTSSKEFQGNFCKNCPRCKKIIIFADANYAHG
jgi:hypothetical protein